MVTTVHQLFLQFSLLLLLLSGHVLYKANFPVSYLCKLFLLCLMYGTPIEIILSGDKYIHTSDDIHKCSLAGTGRTKDCNKFTFFTVKLISLRTGTLSSPSIYPLFIFLISIIFDSFPSSSVCVSSLILSPFASLENVVVVPSFVTTSVPTGINHVCSLSFYTYTY